MNKKLSIDEIRDLFIQITQDYTDCFFKSPVTKDKILDKQYWAALHLGFLGGMKVNGYSEDYICRGLDKALRIIEKKGL